MRSLTWCCLAGLLLTCRSYNPVLADCKVSCGPSQACPEGYECQLNWCRPAGSTGGCVCNPGDQRPCGGGLGVCTPGLQTCTGGAWGPCMGEGKSSVEKCDGLDNDCDGEVDNAISDAPPCANQNGVCHGSTQRCVDAGFVACDPSSYGSGYEPLEKSCDGLDNDCDGITDGTGATLLMSGVGAYDLHELDAGYVVAASQQQDDGGFAAVALLLDPQLKPRGPPILLPGGGGAYESIYIDATAWGGTAYVAYSTRDAGADVHLVALDPDGTVRPFATVTNSQLQGWTPLTVGVDGTSVSVAYVSGQYPSDEYSGTQATLVTWRLADAGGYELTHFEQPAGGDLAISTATVSPLRAATFFTGYDYDAGAYVLHSASLKNSKTGAGFLPGGYFLQWQVYRLDDTGGVTHEAAVNIGASFSGTGRSDMFYQADVLTPVYPTEVKHYDDTSVIRWGNLGRGPLGPEMVWTENSDTLFVGTVIGSQTVVRVKSFTPLSSNATCAQPDVALTGASQLMALTYVDGVLNVADLYGQLVCPP